MNQHIKNFFLKTIFFLFKELKKILNMVLNNKCF